MQKITEQVTFFAWIGEFVGENPPRQAMYLGTKCGACVSRKYFGFFKTEQEVKWHDIFLVVEEKKGERLNKELSFFSEQPREILKDKKVTE